MSEQGQNSSRAMKPFVGGLILGLLIGGFLGACVTPYFETPVPKLKPAAPRSGPAPTGPRDERPVETPPPAPTGPAENPPSTPPAGPPK